MYMSQTNNTVEKREKIWAQNGRQKYGRYQAAEW
jgi:hypothetical protein